MISFQEKISNDLKAALKAKDPLRLSCLRMLKTALKTKQAEQGNELKEPEIQVIISSLIRKGQEASKEFRDGGREELAIKEENEIKIFYEYLPDQLNPDEIEKILKEIVSELEVNNPKDLGKVMKVAMARMAGKAQGKEVSEIARKLMS